MMDHLHPAGVDRPFRRLLSKVPEVTVFFWIIKILCVTVGGTFADFLSTTLGLGLTLTTVVTSVLFGVTVLIQFQVRRYVPALYWLTVVLAGIVGTLLSDNLVNDLDVPLTVTAVVFAVALGATFLIWYRTEGTLSIHTVDSPRREAFYWLTVLLTFALGAASGDLAAETLGFGYLLAAMGFASVIALIGLGRILGLDAIVTFWAAFIVTRPLGAALGDLLSQPAEANGLGLGTGVTSLVFLTTIVVVVVYLTRSGADKPALR